MRLTFTRRDLLRLAAGAPLAALVGCDKIGREVHIGSSYIATPDRPLTPTDLFYVVSNFGQADAPAADDWRLGVRGMVDRPATLRRADLDGFPEITRDITLECIGNTPGGRLISSAAFTGVRIRDVLLAAGPSEHARGVHLEAEEGYFAYLPLGAALADEPLIVHSMNGEPLTAEHGAPVRALFPGRHGMFSVKWLRRITLARNWGSWGALTAISNVVEGVTPVKSRIDVPFDGEELPAGREIDVAGLALSAGRGVARVELRVDGDWQPVEIVFNDEGSPYLWSLWRARLPPRDPGPLTLSVRAFDRDGRTQSFAARFPYDSGAIHTVRVVVR